MKKKRMIIFFIIIFVLSLQITAYANEPYKGYTYNEWDESVPSPNGYTPELTISGDDIGVGRFISPKDFFVLNNSDIYILDSGNGRVVILDSEYRLKKVIDKIYNPDTNEEDTIKNATGIFVTDDKIIFIADAERNRVVALNQEGEITRIITKPLAAIYPKDNEFSVKKVLVDKIGTVYVIVSGLYYGAAMFDESNSFMGFYGSNRVELTVRLLQDVLFKRFMTQEQKENMERYVPVEYTSFDIDNNNFIYTCTASTTLTETNELRKLNPLGENVMQETRFGDLEADWFKGEINDSSFVDVNVDDEGFINMLDFTRGRVFQYDKDANFMFSFGAIGKQKGAFKYPEAIETLNGRILVLDSQKSNITVFKLTEFGEYVHEAIKLYNEGMYNEAVGPWQEVLKRNMNFDLAYVGIGKALYNIEEYKEAARYFKIGKDRLNQSKAFKEYRTKVIRENFSWIFLVFLLIVITVYVLNRKEKFKEILHKVFTY